MIYVVSDIHRNLQRFDSILKQIQLQPDDTLYVLGDVIDRYPDGIRILGRIMKMPNVKMLLGNHEYMMLNAIGHCSDAAEEEFHTNWSGRSLWYRNGGEVTHWQLKHMRKDFRAKLFDYLYHLPVNLETEVNGVRYKLVHASPVENYKGIKEIAFRPNYFTKHLHRDDHMFISYDKAIRKTVDERGFVDYHGYDAVIYGGVIVRFIRAVRKFGNYDIEPIAEEVKKKEKYFLEKYPEECECLSKAMLLE